jgi:hypothetical protein
MRTKYEHMFIYNYLIKIGFCQVKENIALSPPFLRSIGVYKKYKYKVISIKPAYISRGYKNMHKKEGVPKAILLGHPLFIKFP